MKTGQAIEQMMAEIMTNTLKSRQARQCSPIRRDGPGDLRRPRRRPTGWLLAGALVIVSLTALTWEGHRADAQAPGPPLTVNQPGDAGDGVCDSTCTLRDAVLAANATPSADTINFDPALTTVTLDNEILIAGGGGALSINGNGAKVFTIDGGPGDNRIFFLNSANVTITDVTLTGGEGGGTFFGPVVENTGGAIAGAACTLLLDRVHVTNNWAIAGVGGVNIQNGNLRIRNSTVSANTAPSCSGINAGGINNTLQVVNSTISGNWSTSSTGVGGGVCTTASAVFRNVTIAGNRASWGGGIFQTGGTLALANTIVAENTADTSSPEILFQSGILNSAGFNLIGDSPGDAASTSLPITYQMTDILDTPPMLFPLDDYGGPTPTHAIRPGSPLIDAGSQNFAFDFDGSFLQTDQRGNGFHRVVGNEVDMGAFEVQASTPPPTPTPDIATSFVVNSANDPGTGGCDATECTLSEAITAANADGGAESITFDSAAFAAPGPHTINLSGALPNLSSDMTIQGPGANILTVRRDTGGDYRIFTIGEGQTVVISGLTISNGTALANLDPLGDGGGILNLGALTLTNSVVSLNSARFCGGGICNRGAARVINSRVTSNDSDHSGGGIGNRGTLTIENSTVSDNSSLFYGGGVFNRWTATACSVTNSTVSGNHTGDSGGGIFSESQLTLTSSTVSGNRSDGYGGGIADEGTLSVTSATITNNRADADNNGTGTGGGLFFQYDYPPLRNTIVAGNYRGTTSPTDDDIERGAWGSLDGSSSFNLIGTGGSGGLADGVNSNQVGVASRGLSPLADNGGFTETHALQTGSPAIDMGNSFGLATDQRGSLRPNDDPAITNASGGDGSDIGAFEVPPRDNDGDVVPDAWDNCPTTPNPNQADNDNDRQGDACDSDDDNDGQTDADEIACGSNPFDAASRAPDNDADNRPDCVDTDDDNDGVLDANDNCQFMPNPDQANTDGDSEGDACDPDDDNDGVADMADQCQGTPPNTQVNSSGCPDADGDGTADASDNCPSTSNASQADNDGDGQGDVCDPDDDNDGVADTADTCPLTANPNQADADGDGIGDVCDSTPRPDTASSFVVNSANDPGDGVCDAAECTLREAIAAANAAAGAGTITLTATGTINLSGALPDLSTDMTIQGPGANALTVRRDTGGDYRIFTVVGSVVTISGLTVSNGNVRGNGNFPDNSGGGISNQLGVLNLTNSIVRGNTAASGGGISNDSGVFNIKSSTVSDNAATHGGGIANVPTFNSGDGFDSDFSLTNSSVSGNIASEGGGIYNYGSLTLTNSTVSGNIADTFLDRFIYPLGGGGIFNGGRSLVVTNCTISGNFTRFGGGGISNKGSAILTSVTITNNRAHLTDGAGSGGIYISALYANSLLLQNSIVADNYLGDANPMEDNLAFSWDAFWGVNPASSFNLIGTGDSGGLTNVVNNNQVGVENPGLGPLASNGGPTQTHALQPGSPAIDRGGVVFFPDEFGSLTDQRGSARPDDDPAITNASGGDGSDIGAFERQPGNAMSAVTPAGSNVAVQLGPVGVTFSGVSAPGTTSQVSIDPATAGTLPGGYSLGPGLPAYEITTTAQYTPPVTVCLNLPSVNEPATFATLRILHGEGGLLVDRTILPPDSPAPDFNSRTICASVTSLSPFVVAQLLTPTGDTTAPAVSILTPLDGATFVKGQSVAAGYSCQDEAGGSGLASCTGTVANGAPIDTSSVGSHTLAVTGADAAGNSATAASTYNVVYGFGGFLQPVDNLPALNIANAGSAIPVKFSLGGNQGLAIFAAGYPASRPIPCDASEPGTVIEETVAAGSSSLSYNAVTDQYNYVWKTDRAWRGTCRMLVVRFNDGTEHRAKFRFK
jgi:CSLREA domain-containing protein